MNFSTTCRAGRRRGQSDVWRGAQAAGRGQKRRSLCRGARPRCCRASALPALHRQSPSPAAAAAFAHPGFAAPLSLLCCQLLLVPAILLLCAAVRAGGWVGRRRRQARTFAFCIMRSCGSTDTASRYTQKAHRICRAAPAQQRGASCFAGPLARSSSQGAGEARAALASPLQPTLQGQLRAPAAVVRLTAERGRCGTSALTSTAWPLAACREPGTACSAWRRNPRCASPGPSP